LDKSVVMIVGWTLVDDVVAMRLWKTVLTRLEVKWQCQCKMRSQPRP
jgi:hypothetical protein